MNNPYTNRGTIRDPREFYGRERELRRIFSRISSSHPQCISVIGERKMGKSSLMYFISHEDTRRKWLDDVDSYIFVLMDLQERASELSFSGFFQFIFRTLAEQLDDSLIPCSLIEGAASEAVFYEAFKQLVSNVDKRGLKLILLFDEFGVVTGSESFDAAFFSFLRSIANNYECAYITTSREKLQNLCRDTDISESPFFNIFSPVSLGQFHNDEARSLIFTPAEQAGVKFHEREAEFILSLAGYHPLFIQIACSALFEHKTGDGGSSGKVDMEAVKADFLLEATEHFEGIWQDAEKGEQEVLCQVALGADVADHQRYFIRELQRRGYLTSDPPVPFSWTFSDFLMAKRPYTEHTVKTRNARKIHKQSAKRTSFKERIKTLFKSGGNKA